MNSIFWLQELLYLRSVWIDLFDFNYQQWCTVNLMILTMQITDKLTQVLVENSACSCNPFIWFLCKLGEKEDEPAPFCTRKEGKQTKRLTMNIFLVTVMCKFAVEDIAKLTTHTGIKLWGTLQALRWGIHHISFPSIGIWILKETK
jgi:hypothetical protein